MMFQDWEDPLPFTFEDFQKAKEGHLTLELLSAEAYRDASLKAKELPLLQAPSWAKVKHEWEPLRFGLKRDKVLCAVAQVLLRPLPLGLKLAYLSFGPVVLEDGEAKDRYLLLERLLPELKSRGCFLIKVHLPEIRKRFILGDEEPSENAQKDKLILKLMASMGFSHKGFSRALDSTVQPRYQAMLYRSLWPAEPEGKIRYNLRQCARRSVTCEKAGQQNLKGFLHCIEKTEARQAINLRDQAYFERLLDAFGEDASLYHAVLDGAKGREKTSEELRKLKEEIQNLGDKQPKKRRQLAEQEASLTKMLDFFESLDNMDPTVIASALAVHLKGLSEMPYAGADERYFEIPATWGIYVAVAEDAFQRGSEKLNLGGVDGHFNDGLSRFKRHFSPVIEENYGEFDLALRPFWAKLFETALALRKRFRI